MKEKTKTTKTKRKRKPANSQRRNPLGGIFLMLFGMVSGGLGVYVYQTGWEQSLDNFKRFVEGAPTPVRHNPSTGGRVVEATPMDLRPLHEQDPRWEKAIAQGEEGVALFEKAVQEQYNGHGDPFVFRSRMVEAKEMMEHALSDLEAMKEEYANNQTATVEIEKKIRRYSGSLEEYGPKARLR